MEILALWGPVSGGIAHIAEDLSVCLRVYVCECGCMQSQAGNRSIPLLSRALRLSPHCPGWYMPGQRALRSLIHQMMYCSNANTLERSSCATLNTPTCTDDGLVTHTECACSQICSTIYTHYYTSLVWAFLFLSVVLLSCWQTSLTHLEVFLSVLSPVM